LTEIILLTLYSAMCKRRGLKFWSTNQWKLSLVIDHLKAIIKGGALSKKY
jgi:hypothetical protein